MAGKENHPDQDATNSEERRAAIHRARRALETRICESLLNPGDATEHGNREFGLREEPPPPDELRS